MATKIRIGLCIVAVVAPAWIGLGAAEPETPRTSGKVLVLDNERTLEGDIERMGAHSTGFAGRWANCGSVSRIRCVSVRREKKRMPSCVPCQPARPRRASPACPVVPFTGLGRQALEEATAAVELRPNHPESRRLLRSLQRASTDRSSSPPAKPVEEAAPATTPPPPELSTESLSLFITRVQPILMNTCANCHATGRGGAFKFTRTYELGMSSRKSTQQNLAAVLAQINRERPSASPLLTKAVSVHGKAGDMAKSPLKNREVAAYRSLEEWVRITVENSPQLHDKSPMPISPSPITERTSAVEPTAMIEARAPRQPVAEDPVDPFDAMIFNRQMHSQQR